MHNRDDSGYNIEEIRRCKDNEKRIAPQKDVLEIRLSDNAADILKQVIEFLQLFLSETLAKRLVALILLAIGVPVVDAVELSGLSERSLWSLKKNMKEATVAEVMVIKPGNGRKRKTADIESQILDELESNNYHTRQEIVDMINEKFHVCISRSSVGRLLKKRHSAVKERINPS